MPLTDFDRRLLRRCLSRETDAWGEFVDRFLGVIYHVVHHTCHTRSVTLQRDDVEDLACEVLSKLVDNDFRILRNFRGKSSLATYLTVVARRIIASKIAQKLAVKKYQSQRDLDKIPDAHNEKRRLEDAEAVEKLLDELQGREADVIRAFYIEHKSYKQISEELGVPENTIGPILSRLRARLRKKTIPDF